MFVLSVIVAGCGKTPDVDPFDPDATPPFEFSPLGAIETGLGGVAAALDAVGLKPGPTPGDYARLVVTEGKTPDARIRGINGLAAREFGREGPYTDAYAVLAESAADPLVRATAVRALNRSRSIEHAALFVRSLDDEAARVRLEAAKALVNVPAEGAAEPLLARVADGDEELDVRIAAVSALRHYDRPEVRERLAALLDGEEFSLAFQARVALAAMVGEDRGYDPAAYLAG